MEWLNINTAVCDRRALIACVLIIALTFHRLLRSVVYTQNGLLTAYLNPALHFHREGANSDVLALPRNASAQLKSSIVWDFCAAAKCYSIDAVWVFVDLNRLGYEVRSQRVK